MRVKQFILSGLLYLMVLMMSSDLVYAQFEHHGIGARPAGMGGSGLAIKRDLWAAYANPALYATFQSITSSITYVPARFSLTELQSSAASLVVPIRGYSPSVSLHRYGYELYSETTVSIANARRIGDRVLVGGKLNWYHLSIHRYGSASAFGVNAGVYVEVSHQLAASAVVSNINRPTIGQGRSAVPQVIIAGLSYRPFPLLKVGTELRKDIRFEPELTVGAEYFLTEVFLVRGGFNDRPARGAGGFSVKTQTAHLDYAFQWHSELGHTHFITLTLRLSRSQPARKSPPVVRDNINIRPAIPTRTIIGRYRFTASLQHPVEFSLIHFLNTAEIHELVTLPGVGPVLAERIYRFRTETGPFRSLDQFLLVQGIGERTLERIIEYWKQTMRSNGN